MKYIPFLVLLFPMVSYGQNNIPVGSWRVHLAYHNAKAIAETPKRIYCASQSGLFYLDKEDRNVEVLSKVDGLNDSGVSALAYHWDKEKLIVGYASGNIDIVSADGIVNVDEIVKRGFDRPQINNITFDDSQGLAYLSTGFGLVELDMDKGLLIDSYVNLGQGGTEIEVFESAVLGDSIFIACEEGLKKASLLGNVNRLDFNTWGIEDTRLTSGIENVVAHQGQIIFTSNFDSVYSYTNGQLRGLPFAPRVDHYLDLSSNDKKLVVTFEEYVFVQELDGTYNGYGSSPTNMLLSPEDALIDSDGKIWFADLHQGLGRLDQVQPIYRYYHPSGTYSKDNLQLRADLGRIACASGGIDDLQVGLNNGAGFYLFEDGLWDNFNAHDTLLGSIIIPEARDIMDIAFHPFKNEIYYGSYSHGVFVHNLETKTTKAFGNANMRQGITSLAFDMNGVLWVGKIGESIEERLYQIDTAGVVLQPGNSSTLQPRSFSVDIFGNLWFVSRGSAISANPQMNILSYSAGNSDFDGSVQTVTADLSGSVWIGTDDGIYELTNPSQAVDGEDALVRTPFVDRNQTLKDTHVFSIAVDGGNRLWVGSDDGVRLFDNGATELIHHFTTNNSPLLDNTVHTIAVNDETGEVFFGTPKGIISYRADATIGYGVHYQTKVFPNPVAPGFGGLVTISGLAYNVDVKITDVSGQLVWQSRSNGGTASWDLYDYKGRRAKSGIYLVFTSDSDGEETFMTKFAVVE